ncbi:unnamed protein product [Sphenostylis stenocarpa]|uniref:Uncharacterized protein n=1 Tax=Sphenostylis stenocarpa TaxID=92480 RepID=A0AA86VDP5_9FABA|nr:unnamed protein product [Sphenostylis stenocarpa]
MSKGSSEREDSAESEGVIIITSPEEGEKDYLKEKLIIQPQRMVEEVEECKTPTWSSRNQITTMLECPPAPRKKRQQTSPISSHMMMRALTIDDDDDHLSFFQEVEPGEMELFFQSINDFTRANK